MSIGDKIKELRKKAGIYNQEELAFRLGTARQTVSSWERGVFLPDSKNLKRLAEELNTTVSYLLGEEDVVNENEESSEVVHSENIDSAEVAMEYQIVMRCFQEITESFVIRRIRNGRSVQYELSGGNICFLRDMVEDIWKRTEKFVRD